LTIITQDALPVSHCVFTALHHNIHPHTHYFPVSQFSDEVIQLLPERESDFRHLEGLLQQHQSIDIQDVPLPSSPEETRESMLCRMLTFTFTAAIRSERLLESIIREFNEFNLHAVYVLVRSHLELAALARFANKNIREHVTKKDVDRLDRFLEKLVLGNLFMSKEHEYPVKPFHIGSVVRELEKISPQIPRMYYFLSEFTHPNMGALVLTSQPDLEKGVNVFNRRRPPRDTDFMQTVNIAIATAELILKDVSELLLLDVSALED
jgi:hypothetical protein